VIRQRLLSLTDNSSAGRRPPTSTLKGWKSAATRGYSACVLWFLFIAATAGAADLPTVAEKSNYRSTSTHEEVVAFCRDLARLSKKVTLDELGASQEGKKLPLLILANPPIATREDAAKSGKLLVFLMGNIHAGEVDGKEALLALARDVALAENHPLLKDLVILIAPIFNADGNDRIAKTNRPEQNGPINGVGIRANAQGFDLNRDFIKLESPEIRALVRFFNRWDPAVVIDTHTTNGSFHRYKLTYDGPRHPAADARVIDYCREKWIPDAGRRLKEKTLFDSYFYGNFDSKHTRWESYPALPRYGIQYVALRNRIALLSESYVYASYKDRITASRAFVEGCLENAAANREKIAKLLSDADKPRDKIALRIKTVSLGMPVTVLGFVEEEKDGKRTPSKMNKDYTVDAILRCEATESVQRPWAYLLPADQHRAADVLRLHGIAVGELTENAEIEVECQRVTKVTRVEREFQKHRAVSLEIESRSEKRMIPAGALIIRTEQRLGALAAYLLEARSEDGLATWNFFDEALAEAKDYPVLRIAKRAAIKVK
jgi:hypothetical protein